MVVVVTQACLQDVSCGLASGASSDKQTAPRDSATSLCNQQKEKEKEKQESARRAVI